MMIKVSKGQQITIPSEFRKELGLHEGSKIEVARKGNKIIITPIGEDLAELFKQANKLKPRHKLTAKQMDELVENEIFRQ